MMAASTCVGSFHLRAQKKVVFSPIPPFFCKKLQIVLDISFCIIYNKITLIILKGGSYGSSIGEDVARVC